MELILLIIYSVIVWLIFFKFKLLPWNITSQVIVVTIPIIALTAHAMSGDRASALASGCDGYISKPIDTQTFGAEVGRYLGR